MFYLETACQSRPYLVAAARTPADILHSGPIKSPCLSCEHISQNHDEFPACQNCAALAALFPREPIPTEREEHPGEAEEEIKRRRYGGFHQVKNIADDPCLRCGGLRSRVNASGYCKRCLEEMERERKARIKTICYVSGGRFCPGCNKPKRMEEFLSAVHDTYLVYCETCTARRYKREEQRRERERMEKMIKEGRR